MGPGVAGDVDGDGTLRATLIPTARYMCACQRACNFSIGHTRYETDDAPHAGDVDILGFRDDFAIPPAAHHQQVGLGLNSGGNLTTNPNPNPNPTLTRWFSDSTTARASSRF